MKRVLAALLCIALIGAAHPKPKSKHPVGQKVLPIAVILNGTKLEVNPAPVFYKDHLLVPVRRILTALGLSFDKNDLAAHREYDCRSRRRTGAARRTAGGDQKHPVRAAAVFHRCSRSASRVQPANE
jgi:hypothetical protein